jgi:hypothetical protein
MGVEFLQSTAEQRDQVLRMIKTLRTNGDKSPDLQVEPDGLETSSPEDSVAMFLSSGSDASADQGFGTEASGSEDTLVDLFRQKFQMPVETFLQQMREQRQSAESHAG